MPRIRTIKPEFFTSEQVVECSTNARLLFVGMWCFCDDGGVHAASASRLKMEVFPADPFTVADIASMVRELLSAGLLQSYVVDGKEFWRVTGWHHQKIDKPTYIYPRSREFGEQSSSVRRGFGESSTPDRNRVESNNTVSTVSASPPHAVEKKAWKERTEQLQSLIDRGDGDLRIVVQLAWLIESRQIEHAFVIDKLAYVRQMKPKNPGAYLRSILAKELGRTRLNFLLAQIPEKNHRKESHASHEAT